MVSMRFKRLFKFLKGSYLALILLFLYAPIFVLMVYSFNESRSMGRFTGLSFKWYGQLFQDAAVVDALVVTLTVAALSAFIATVVGTAAAIGLHSMRKGPRRIIENISQFPMVNPDLVTGISLMMVFAMMSFRNSYLRLLVAHITFNLPYVIFSVLPKLRQSSNLLYEAALDIGCTPLQALFKVVVPDIMPGIVSGFILAFTLSLDDFAVSYFASTSTQNLSIYVYSMARMGINPKINALSTLMFIAVVTLLLIVNIKSIREEREAAIQHKKTAKKRNR